MDQEENLDESEEIIEERNFDEEEIHLEEASEDEYDLYTDSSETYSDDDDDDFGFHRVEEDEGISENVPIEIEQLRELGTKMTQTNLDELLKILRVRLLPTLPKSAKTFLRTADAKYGIFPMQDMKGGMGEFVYFSIKKSLEDIVNPEIHEEKIIELQISVDSVSLKNSSCDEFWVTSGKIHFDPDVYPVFPISIYCGTCKPNSSDDYMENFINEFNELLTRGVYVKEHLFIIKLKCLICDTPARAFLKDTLGHTGLEACERCEVVGEKVDRTTVFPSTDAIERTDESFRNFHQPNHHHGSSPLSRITPPINMIFIFILDFMHLFCIGIMKKLIEYWLHGNNNVRLDVRARQELSRRLESIRSNIPLEFQRKTRSIYCVPKWKATEYRFFLLYCGPVILRKLFSEQNACFYDHFLLLHVAARILCSESFCYIYIMRAKNYLRTFFSSMQGFYGIKSQTVNSHHLIHVFQDVITMKCNLTRITAFPFESFLGKLKRLFRTPNRPLAQVCRRLYERQHLQSKRKVQIPPVTEILEMRDEENITKIRHKQYTLTNTSPDNMILLNNGTIVSIKNIFLRERTLMLQCQVWRKEKPIYNYPFSSEKFDMWQLYFDPTEKIVETGLKSLSSKLIKLQLSLSKDGPEKVYVISFLH